MISPTTPSRPRLVRRRQPSRARRLATIALVFLSVFALSSSLAAQDEREPGWYDTAELSFLMTGGNSEADTFSFKNTLERLWDGARFKLTASALRAESTTTDRFAQRIGGSIVVTELSESELTAENYAVRSRYDRDLGERLFWYVGLDWERNEFAGFDSRTIGLVGAGHRWWSTDDSVFVTDYAVTYTTQDDLVELPGGDDSFLGARFSYEYKRALTQTTTYGSDLILDLNVDETDDWRGDMSHWLAVEMTQKLALKVNLRLLYDNMPSLAAVPVVDENFVLLPENVLVELDELDTALSIALVVSF